MGAPYVWHMVVEINRKTYKIVTHISVFNYVIMNFLGARALVSQKAV